MVEKTEGLPKEGKAQEKDEAEAARMVAPKGAETYPTNFEAQLPIREDQQLYSPDPIWDEASQHRSELLDDRTGSVLASTLEDRADVLTPLLEDHDEAHDEVVIIVSATPKSAGKRQN